MTCSSCEVIIERKLKNVPGVEKVKASKSKDSVELECSDQVQVSDLQAAVKDHGYTLSLQKSADQSRNQSRDQSGYQSRDQNSIPQNWFSKHKERFSEIGAVLVLIIGAYFLLKQLDFLPKNLVVTDNMGYGFIFILGLVAALSTCLAVAGGLLLSISAKFNEKNPTASSRQKFKPHIFFNVGRVISYTLLGGAIGALGSVLTLSSTTSGIVTIIASALMIVMGLQLLGVFPWLNKIQIKMPKFIAHKVYDAEGGHSSKIAPFLFGASTFFLPCGFTQALQLYVLGKGSFVVGALTMLAFSIGTLPSLMSIGAFSSFTKGNLQRYFTTFAAVLVIILGAANLAPGFNLTGAVIALPSAGIPDVPSGIDIPLVDGKQVINMAVNGFDYSPDTFTLKKGVPVQWNIDGQGARGCAKIISVPALGIMEQLSSGVKTVEFTPQKTGKIKFSCGMGMAGPGFFEVIA